MTKYFCDLNQNKKVAFRISHTQKSATEEQNNKERCDIPVARCGRGAPLRGGGPATGEGGWVVGRRGGVGT